MSASQSQIDALEARIGYSFKDKALFERALTHSSYGDGRRNVVDNERLEFLGDRVLGLLTAQMLFENTQTPEGEMARRLNSLVRKETCASVARKIDMPSALKVSASEKKQGGRDKTSILGDACEALLAAIYLDGGMEAAKAFYDKYWADEIKSVFSRSAKDAKTLLQEMAAAAGLDAPRYSLKERRGPDHKPFFVMAVSVNGKGEAIGDGKSKKEAEREAAGRLIEKWSAL